jgi:hypothetical protein
MVSAILSFTGIPIVIAVIGFALGMNAIMKEHRFSDRRPIQRYIAIGGCIVCTLSVIAYFLFKYI